jgi:2-polyprenyl-3-methyl-5-hydroxy-6-metoxy-1,4-benzoquinol methylase
MAVMQPKETSYEYGRAYQLHQAEKFRNRKNNRWKIRIDLAFELFAAYVERHAGRNPDKIVVVDVGCSVGTFAIEFAKRGFRAYGVDFDPAAIEIAKKLADEEQTAVEFACQDVSGFFHTYGQKIDVAVCFDIFEHLHDDELGALFRSLKSNLAEGGSILFHTYPSEYGYLFQSSYLHLPLAPFAILSAGLFTRITRVYASMIDACLLLAGGGTHRERIKLHGHCNPLTITRLEDISRRAGLEVVALKSADLYGLSRFVQLLFSRQPVAHQNIYGVLRMRRSGPSMGQEASIR